MAKKMGEDREGIVFEKQEKRDFPEEGDNPRQILFRDPGPLRTEAFAVLSVDAFGGSNLELGLEGSSGGVGDRWEGREQRQCNRSCQQSVKERGGEKNPKDCVETSMMIFFLF